MRSLNLSIVLDRLICHDEGDGSGNAEPYIWAIFFKLDRDTANFGLLGITGKRDPDKPVQVWFSRGSHGNLSSAFIDIDGDGMDAGDNIPIPGDVGYWSTTLKSTLIPNFNEPNGPPIDIPGFAGVLYLLLEEDAVTHGAAEAGHRALNEYFESKINAFFLNLNLPDLLQEAGRARNTTRPTVAEIKATLARRLEAFKVTAIAEGKSRVIQAIKSSLSFPDIVAAGIDPDDMFGEDLLYKGQDELLVTPLIPFQKLLPVPMQRLEGGGLELASDGLFTVTGYFRASPYEESVVLNEIPVGVRELIIDSTLKHIAGIPQKSFIRAIGGIHAAKPFVIDRFRAMQLIRSGQMRFFIQSGAGGPDGRVEILAHAASPTQRFDYLATEPNDTTADNLWSLPDCKMTYVES
jgi:hypothetical protein